jgi:hypothetical protein
VAAASVAGRREGGKEEEMQGEAAWNNVSILLQNNALRTHLQTRDLTW